MGVLVNQAGELLEAALQLASGERKDLIFALSRSLYADDLGQDWEQEIERRAQDIDAGRVQLVSGPTVLERLEKRFGTG